MKIKPVFVLFPPIAGVEIYPRVQNFLKVFKALKIPFDLEDKQKRVSNLFFLFILLKITFKSLKYPQVLTFSSNVSFFIVLFYKLILRKKVVIDHFQTKESCVQSRNFILNYLEKLSYKKADIVLTHTESMKAILCKYYNIEKSKVVPIYCFVDTELFKRKEDDKLARSLDLKENDFIIIYHGLFHSWHGLPYFLNSLPKIIKKHPNLVFIFIGATYEEAIAYYKEFNIIDRKYFRFVPRMNDEELPRYLSLGRVWVGRFNQNIFGKRAASACMFEAMSMGLAPLTSHSTEDDKIINDKVNGILVSEKDSKDIQNKLLYYLDNEKLINTMSKNARKTIVGQYDISSVKLIFKNIFL